MTGLTNQSVGLCVSGTLSSLLFGRIQWIPEPNSLLVVSFLGGSHHTICPNWLESNSVRFGMSNTSFLCAEIQNFITLGPGVRLELQLVYVAISVLPCYLCIDQRVVLKSISPSHSRD